MIIESGPKSQVTDLEKTIWQKIDYGMRLAYKRLVLKTQLEDGVLIKTIDGKVTEVRARDIDVSDL